MFIIKRETLTKDKKSIKEIKYIMYTNFTTATEVFEAQKLSPYTNSGTLYEVIDVNIGFNNVDEIVSYMYDNNKGKIVESFDNDLVGKGVRQLNEVVINGTKLTERQASLIQEAFCGITQFGFQTDGFITDVLNIPIEEANEEAWSISGLFKIRQ